MGVKTVLGVDYRVAVRALVILVLAFTVQTIYQQVRVRKLQRELEEQHVQAEVFRRLAMFDPLTGLYNRRFAEQRLKAEIARSERRGHALIVVLVDLNDFKEINDKFGHQTGDLVLKDFAKRLSSSTRGSDVAARWGGDEFMMLLVDCEIEQLSRVLVRLEGFEVPLNGKKMKVSVAAGWKAYEPGDRMEELIEGADRRLYYNKEIVKKREPMILAKV
jgi:diguanylate cyclase (GGDEF)-like protein